MVGGPILRLKQGATLALDLLVTDDLGQPVDLASATVNVVFADALGTIVATLPMTRAAQAGWGTITGTTGSWPVGTLNGECQVTANGATTLSDTFTIAIERSVAA